MKQLMLLSGVLLGSLLGVAPARAYTMAAQCVIANTLCFPLRASASGMTVERRIDQINDRLAFILGYETLQPENVRTRLTSEGAEHEVMTLERFAQFMRTESARWAKIIRERNVRAQNQLVDDLLDINRITAGQMPTNTATASALRIRLKYFGRSGSGAGGATT